MATLYGREYSRAEIESKVGDIAQIAGVRLGELGDGRERGVRVADFRTGSGFAFTVHIDRGLDIGAAEYAGAALAHRTAAGVVGPAYYEPEGIGWVKGFPCGLMTTCGLTFAGHPCEDQGKPLGLHGPASYIPATNVWADGVWQGDEYEMFIQGKVREGYLFGDKLELTRRIWARLGESRLFISDRVTNYGATPAPHMIMYHCNFGFPLIDEGTELRTPSPRGVEPATESARAGVPRCKVFDAPKPGIGEEVFYHDLPAAEDGTVTVSLVNPRFQAGRGLGVYLRYRQRELPVLVEWKMMGAGDYVVGLEPSNCHPIGGRAAERARGTLVTLQPGESVEYQLEIGVLP